MNPSITTSNENRKNSAANSDGMTGQPISSLQRAIRNTIIGGVKSSISRQSDSDHDQAVSDKSQPKPDEILNDDSFFGGWDLNTVSMASKD